MQVSCRRVSCSSSTSWSTAISKAAAGDRRVLAERSKQRRFRRRGSGVDGPRARVDAVEVRAVDDARVPARSRDPTGYRLVATPCAAPWCACRSARPGDGEALSAWATSFERSESLIAASISCLAADTALSSRVGDEVEG